MDKFDKGFPVPSSLPRAVPADFKGWTSLEVTAAQAFELITGVSPREAVINFVLRGSEGLTEPVSRYSAAVESAKRPPVFRPHDHLPGMMDRGTLYLPPEWPIKV